MCNCNFKEDIFAYDYILHSHDQVQGVSYLNGQKLNNSKGVVKVASFRSDFLQNPNFNRLTGPFVWWEQNLEKQQISRSG